MISCRLINYWSLWPSILFPFTPSLVFLLLVDVQLVSCSCWPSGDRVCEEASQLRPSSSLSCCLASWPSVWRPVDGAAPPPLHRSSAPPEEALLSPRPLYSCSTEKKKTRCDDDSVDSLKRVIKYNFLTHVLDYFHFMLFYTKYCTFPSKTWIWQTDLTSNMST